VKYRFGLGCLLAAATLAAPAFAGGGYFSGHKGARAAGRGGAFTARADDVSAVTLNPAGLALLEGTTLQASNRFSYNAHFFTRAPTLDWGKAVGGVAPSVGFATVKNEVPWQALDPFIGAVTNLGLEDWAFALAIFAPPGIGRQQFPVDGGQRYMMVSREAIILSYSASAAYRPSETFALGATFSWIAVPKLDYQLVIDGMPSPRAANPVSSDLDMLATVSGSDTFTPNATLGAWFRPVSFLELGVSAQVIPARIETNSTLTLDPLSPGISDSDVRLLRNNVPANDVVLSLPLPLTARAGVRYRHLEGAREVFDVELDVVYETWSKVDKFTLNTNGLVANVVGNRVDIGSIEVDKAWQDTVSVHLGSDYSLVPDTFTLRGGLFYESAVAAPEYANVDFVSGQQLGGGLGFSLFAAGLEVALAYEFRQQLTNRIAEADARVYQEVPASPCQAPYTDPNLCHPAYLGQPSPAVNAGTYDAYSHMATLEVLYRF